MAANQNGGDVGASGGERGRRRVIQGVVVSDKMDKTITVREDRLVQHPLYGKFMRRKTTYKAHDETNQARQGDLVEIALTRPLSKTKSWRLVRIVSTARLAASPDAGEESA
jgi:small subunit ribosomal protein S17